jgi:hypothetical protein
MMDGENCGKLRRKGDQPMKRTLPMMQKQRETAANKNNTHGRVAGQRIAAVALDLARKKAAAVAAMTSVANASPIAENVSTEEGMISLLHHRQNF